MFSIKIKSFLYGSLVTASLISVITYANSDGVFGDYFERMIQPAGCGLASAITGFSGASSAYGQQECMTFIDIVKSVIPTQAPSSGKAVVGYQIDGKPIYGAVNWANSGSDISYTAGNVGIGISLPSLPLDISGSIMARGSTADIDANRNIWAQAFYDRDDSNYYVDPSGTTNLVRLCLSGDCKTTWPGSGTSGGTVTGLLRWSGEYSRQTYDQAWNTCLSLTPANAWRLPTPDEIEYARRVNVSLFTGPRNYWSSSVTQANSLYVLSYGPTSTYWGNCDKTDFSQCGSFFGGSPNSNPMAFRCVSDL